MERMYAIEVPTSNPSMPILTMSSDGPVAGSGVLEGVFTEGACVLLDAFDSFGALVFFGLGFRDEVFEATVEPDGDFVG